jgi:hypothetical protein
MRVLVIKTIKLYQKFLSPLLGQRCRFYPSCSQYALSVIEKHGVLKGGVKALIRVLKCNPYHKGGVDMP